VSIDSVEKATGINFFASLPDADEKVIESTFSINSWSWKTSTSTHKKTGSTASVQCNGITKIGNRCKKRTLNTNGFCYLHQNQTNDTSSAESSQTIIIEKGNSQASQIVQCSGITKAGVRCKRMTRNASGRCYQH
jgi:endonuclease G